MLRALAVVCAAVAAAVALIVAGVIPNPLGYDVEGDLERARGSQPAVRVLFVGNSLTYRNSMPSLVDRLADGDPGARPVFAVRFTAGAASLSRAARQDSLDALLREVRWDAVVLQESSRLPALANDIRVRDMYPAARALDAKIRSAGARTILFMTWGYRDGSRKDRPDDTYASMQHLLAQGYRELAADLPADLAPVGLAWAQALEREPRLDLWAGDGRHPSLLGSYLTACVFYAVLTGRAASASRFTAGLEPRIAQLLQAVATDIVNPQAG